MLILFLLGVALVSMMVFFGFPSGNGNAGEAGLLLPAWWLTAMIVLVAARHVLKTGKEVEIGIPEAEPVVKTGNGCAWTAVVVVVLCGIVVLCKVAS